MAGQIAWKEDGISIGSEDPPRGDTFPTVEAAIESGPHNYLDFSFCGVDPNTYTQSRTMLTEPSYYMHINNILG